MSEFEALLQSLDDMPTRQLEQLNRLLEAVRRYRPHQSLSSSQAQQRAQALGQAVARLRDGISDAELDRLIEELRAI